MNEIQITYPDSSGERHLPVRIDGRKELHGFDSNRLNWGRKRNLLWNRINHSLKKRVTGFEKIVI